MFILFIFSLGIDKNKIGVRDIAQRKWLAFGKKYVNLTEKYLKNGK